MNPPSARKTIVMVFNSNFVAMSEFHRMMDRVRYHGFDPIGLRTRIPVGPSLQIFDLNHLPQAEIDKLEKLAQETLKP